MGKSKYDLFGINLMEHNSYLKKLIFFLFFTFKGKVLKYFFSLYFFRLSN